MADDAFVFRVRTWPRSDVESDSVVARPFRFSAVKPLCMKCKSAPAVTHVMRYFLCKYAYGVSFLGPSVLHSCILWSSRTCGLSDRACFSRHTTAQFKTSLRTHTGVNPLDHLCLAWSGGPASSALLSLLHDCRAERLAQRGQGSYQLTVVHVDEAGLFPHLCSPEERAVQLAEMHELMAALGHNFTVLPIAGLVPDGTHSSFLSLSAASIASASASTPAPAPATPPTGSSAAGATASFTSNASLPAAVSTTEECELERLRAWLARLPSPTEREDVLQQLKVRA